MGGLVLLNHPAIAVSPLMATSGGLGRGTSGGAGAEMGQSVDKPRRNMIITYYNSVDGRMIQTLVHHIQPLTPNINVLCLFGSFLRMDEINQTA